VAEGNFDKPANLEIQENGKLLSSVHSVGRREGQGLAWN